VALLAESRRMDAGQTEITLSDLLVTLERHPALFTERRTGIVLFDRHGNLVRANPAALGILGARIDEVAGLRYRAVLERSERDEARAAFKRAAGGESFEVTASVRMGNGGMSRLLLTLAPATVAGTVVGVYCTAGLASMNHSRSLQELTPLFDRTADAVIVFDRAGLCVDANTGSERLTGFSATELRGRHCASLFVTTARFSVASMFDRVFGGESVTGDTSLYARDGRALDISLTSVPIVVDGEIAGAYTIGRDVSARYRLEASLREQSERLRELSLVAASSDEDLDDQAIAALELGCRRLGSDAAYVTQSDGSSVSYVYSVGDAWHPAGSIESFAGSLHSRIVEATEPVASESYIGVAIRMSAGTSGALRIASARPRADSFTEADRDYMALLGRLVASILERSARRRRADELAFYDQLTGLPNRALFADRLDKAIASAKHHPTVFAVHFYDVDNFKAINDQFGHMRGDEVLRSVARRFGSVARHEDTVARIGGDEFVVIQPSVRALSDVERLARRFQAALSEPLVIDGSEHRLTISAGLALYPENGKDATTLLARADAALYRVKQRGRDNVAFFSSPS
jgi:diguanylate cyclase (GGDEF)-like protein/PAS domain S-box-containing protein